MGVNMRKVELLAPAGNYESFLGAVHAGADAVYLGGAKFGARAYADNFTEEEVCRAVRYAHIYGRKIYLTVNTLVKEREFHNIYQLHVLIISLYHFLPTGKNLQLSLLFLILAYHLHTSNHQEYANQDN